jgi:hypothetical protein
MVFLHISEFSLLPDIHDVDNEMWLILNHLKVVQSSKEAHLANHETIVIMDFIPLG